MIFAFVIHPFGQVFIKGPTYANAFAKARRLAGQEGTSVSQSYLRDTPAKDSDAKQSAGALMIDEVLGDGTILYAGGSNAPVRATGGGSLVQTNFFEGGGSSKVMGSGFDPNGDGEKPPSPGDTGPIIGTEDFGDLYPAFQAGLAERGIGIGPGGGVRGQLADAAFRNLQSRGLLNLALTAPSGAIDTSEWADPDVPTPAELQAAAGPSFQEFARTRGLYGGAGAADALGLFNKALEYSAGRTPGFDTDDAGELKSRFDAPGSAVTYRGSGQLPNLISGAFLNPTQGGATDLARVAREAGRSRFGFASRFMPSAQQLASSYFAQPQEGAMNFADFLNRRIFGT